MPKLVAKSVPDALKHFNELPDEAYVKTPVVQGLYGGISRTTVWRHSGGSIPAPRRWGGRNVDFNVGDLRKALKSK